MSKINFAQTITIDQAATVIPILSQTVEGEDSHITPIIVSEPGVGKTSILKNMRAAMGDKYDYIYVDCPAKDYMDIAATIPNHDTKALEQYVGSLFKLNSNKPKVIMLDEAFKVPKMMGVLFTRLMLERMVGDTELPLGSIVFGTSNNGSDGVGDFVQAHQGNRICLVRMEKPDARRWNIWAGENGVSVTLRSFVAMNPRCLASYMDGGQENNEFIFNPTKAGQGVSFVSPRSLYKANRIVTNREVLGSQVADVLLAGTIGLAAAKALSVFMEMESQVIKTKDVIANPEGVPMPSDMAALCMMMFNAVDDLQTQDELSQYMKFVKRMNQSELQSVFFTMLMGNKRTTKLAANNDDVKAWTKDNYKYL
jgi:hypothetical protein